MVGLPQVVHTQSHIRHVCQYSSSTYEYYFWRGHAFFLIGWWDSSLPFFLEYKNWLPTIYPTFDKNGTDLKWSPGCLQPLLLYLQLKEIGHLIPTTLGRFFKWNDRNSQHTKKGQHEPPWLLLRKNQILYGSCASSIYTSPTFFYYYPNNKRGFYGKM